MVSTSTDPCTTTNSTSAILQAGGSVVVVVEVTRKAYLASLVPVIVNAILNEHQVVADIVAFVPHGDFPRSRLGEKQRGKVLASWVTRKLRTIAQFSIRDVEGIETLFPDAPQSRTSRSSKAGSLMASSLRKSMAPEGELPRSPAPVPEELHAASSAYHEVSEHQIPEIHTPTQDTAPAAPSGQPAYKTVSDSAIPSDRLDHQVTGGPDLGADAPAFGQRSSSLHAGHAQAPAPSHVHEPIPGQQYNPSDVYSVEHGGHHRESLSASDQGYGDWPQEALMYENAYGGEGHDPTDLRRISTNTTEKVNQRYNGSGYGY